MYQNVSKNFSVGIDSNQIRNWFWVEIKNKEPIKYYYFVSKLSELVKWKELKYHSNISFKKNLKIDNLFKLNKIIKNIVLKLTRSGNYRDVIALRGS